MGTPSINFRCSVLWRKMSIAQRAPAAPPANDRASSRRSLMRCEPRFAFILSRPKATKATRLITPMMAR